MRAKEFIPASKPRNFVAKNQKTAGAGAHKDKKKAEKQGDVKHKGKQFDEGVAEGHADQQKKIFKKNGRPVGEVGIDRESSPGVGQWYMKCYATGDDLAGYDSYEEAVEELKHCLQQGVAEGEEIARTHKGGIVTKTKHGIKHTKTDYDDEGLGWRGKDKTDFDRSPYKKFPILDKDDDMDEGWKEKLAAAGLAGAVAMGTATPAQARVSIGPDGQMTPSFAQQMAQNPDFKKDQKSDNTTTLSSRYDSRYQGSPEAGVIKVDGKLYKFAGRTAEAPKTGEKIKVPAAAVGFRGLSPVTVELSSDGMYYPASAD